MKVRGLFILSDISDHFPCILKRLKLNTETGKTVTRQRLTQKVVTKIKNELSTKNLSSIVGGVVLSFTRLHSELIDSLNRHAPEKTVVIRHNKRREPWITRGLERSIKKCNKKYCMYLKDRLNTSKENDYKNYRRSLNKIKRKARKDYYQNKHEELKHNSKKLWKLINRMSRKCSDKTSVIDEIKSGSYTVCGGQQISECFAKYFSEVGKNCASKIPNPSKDIEWYLQKIPRNDHTIFMSPTTPQEIDRLIGKLPNKLSSGYDDINNVLLKELCLLIKGPLSDIFNLLIKEGKSPSAIKLADMVPLYKNKEYNLTTNYRPVSLLLTISKLLEKVIHIRVYKFLESTNQLYRSQYGFHGRHSCETAVGELVAEIIKNMESQKYTLGLLLDLSKAFDMLSHKLLLRKLELYGIRGQTLDWFASYLEGRKLRVKSMSNSGIYYSSYYDVDYGTPQGSCLSPLLFLIFNNDIHRHLTLLSCILFADDTTLFKGHQNLRYLKWCVETELTELVDWFRANGLTLNLNKTVCMLFGTTKLLNKADLNAVSLGDIEVQVNDKVKFLGI